MRRFTLLLLALVPGLLLGALPAGASAGKRAKPAPKVTFVAHAGARGKLAEHPRAKLQRQAPR